MHTTIDGGKEWTELTSKLPVRRWISRVTPSAHAEGTVYVTQRGREDDDFAAYIYKSTTFGRTFRSITNNVPAGSVNVIREDPRNPNVLYVGTDFGVFVSMNGGARWEVLGGNLPSVQVSDLKFEAREPVARDFHLRPGYLGDGRRPKAAAPNDGLTDDPLWYRVVVYQAHVRSFCDSTGDGIGDFPGLTRKLDYIKALGVNCLWILPFYPSPLKDDGYEL